MFLGTHEPRLDEKGRLILPAKFRDELASGLVLLKDKSVVYLFFHLLNLRELQSS